METDKEGGHDMAFELPDLPYSHDALADLGMSRETMEYHHDIHHKAYVDNGNKLIDGTEWAGKSLEDIITGTYQAGAVAQNGIFNNASQHWNHMQFWEMMGPGTGGMPGELESALVEAFGSVDKFKEDFAAAGAGQFASGRRRFWAATCGNTPTTSTSATSAPRICRTSSTTS